MVDKRIFANVSQIPLLEYGINETKDGWIFYLARKGRHVHLTFYSRNGRMNAHITDTTKDPPKVWEMEVDVKWMLSKVGKALERSIQRYNWNETYYVVDAELVKAIGLPLEINGPVLSSMDLLGALRYLSFKREHGHSEYFRRIRIRDGLNAGPLIGFQFQRLSDILLYLSIVTAASG